MAFRPRRQARKTKLLSEGFLPFEAQALSELFLSSPVLRLARKARRARHRADVRADKSKGQRRRDIKKLYTDNKWFIDPTKTATRKGISGQADPWALFRATRQKAIDEGEYIPPKRKKKPRRGLDKGRIVAGRPTIDEAERSRRAEASQRFQEQVRALPPKDQP